MKEILNRLITYKSLNEEESKDILIKISNSELNNSQISSFLTVYMMRNITLQELKGFKDALIELCIKVNLKEFDTIDLCGTGGDGKDTFNISTLASFVTAGSGCNVAKHGNYGVSSGCGSSNVLESLGVKFTNNYDILRKAIDKSGICFLHAPLFHPAMKNVAPVRRELGLKTFFNMLGPLVNPSMPKKQIVGVFNLELARIYNYLLQKIDKKYSNLYEILDSEMPTDIQVMINNNEMASTILRLIEVIGQDNLEALDEDTLFFIISALNQLNIDTIRNKILLKVLPLKV